MTLRDFVARVLVVALASGCASKETFVYGADVHLHLRQLRASGAARVTVHERIDGKIHEPEAEMVRLDQTVELAGVKTTLADLALHCADDPEAAITEPLVCLSLHCAEPAKPKHVEVCELRTHSADELILRAHRHSQAASIGKGIGSGLIAAGLVGSIVCGIACESPISTVSWVALGAFVVLAVASCIHSTCHD